jgi:heat shock protein HslJ
MIGNVTVVMCAALFAAAGCSSSRKPMSANPPSTPDSGGRAAGVKPLTQAEASKLEGVEFQLKSLTLDGVAAAITGTRVKPFLSFVDGSRVAGNSGVNRFSGGYALTGPGEIRWSPGMASTRMAGPPEAMTLESSFLKALQACTRADVAENGLVLHDGGKTRMEFERIVK